MLPPCRFVQSMVTCLPYHIPHYAAAFSLQRSHVRGWSRAEPGDGDYAMAMEVGRLLALS